MLGLLLLTLSVGAFAQGLPIPPPPGKVRDFFEFRGTWDLDQAAGNGRIAGLPVAKQIVITTTPTEFTVVKDGGTPEIYRMDGTETQQVDPRTGISIDRFFRFTLVAGAVALTSRVIRGGSPPERRSTITTDAYSVAGPMMTVERQLSVMVMPPGHVLEMSDASSNQQTLVYRRQGR
jgi:hypothetical protein